MPAKQTDDKMVFQLTTPQPRQEDAWKPGAFLVREVALDVTSAAHDGGWDGKMTLICFSPIDSNDVFEKAVEIELRDPEGVLHQRVIGMPLALRSLSIRRFLTSEEKALYGDSSDEQNKPSITAVITLGYFARRIPYDQTHRFAGKHEIDTAE